MIVFTSEEAVVNAVARAGAARECWAWSEALHFGPVSRSSDLSEFARERAEVFRELGWDDCREIEADFALRNQALQAAVREDGGVVLLFGAGIRDQLSLARILSWIADQEPSLRSRVRLALAKGILPEESDASLAARIDKASAIGTKLLAEYHSAWLAFAAKVPTDLETVARGIENELLKAALGRLLREYPSAENGLSLTEGQILDAVSLGVSAPRSLFEQCGEAESIGFLNNWEFWATLERLTLGESPLLKVEGDAPFQCPPKVLAWKDFHGQSLVLTPFGERVLSGGADYGSADYPTRWIGGAELSKGKLWRWDYASACLLRS